MTPEIIAELLNEAAQETIERHIEEIQHAWTRYFRLPFALFPWFRHATIDQISDVQWPTADHLYWPQLDVDLSVASIRNPADFPLVANVNDASHA